MWNWRVIHYLSYIAVAFFVFEPSYIHPDEHFQSLQVLAGYDNDLPWEFKESNPSRSFAIIYIFYGPVIWLGKTFSFEPLSLMYLARSQLALSFFIVAQISTRILCKTKQENSKSLFLIYTSYITFVHQSHTFSNSIETGLLLIALSLIHLQKEEEKLAKTVQPNYLLHFLLAVTCSIGIFNRITFIAFLLIPGITLIKHYLKFKLSAVLFIVTFISISMLIILADTSLFNSKKLVITPLNNLIYNSNRENLAQHGIHPRYTHLLVNLPQLIGPAMIFLIFRNHYKTSIPYLSIVSGLLFLSIIPHQEARFLMPIVPLVCICSDFTNFESPKTVEWILRAWFVFNLVLGIIMGSFHQRGVIDALHELRLMKLEDTTQLWWKTYSPPTWLLGDSIKHNNKVVDLMGMDVERLINEVKSYEDPDNLLLITSRSSASSLESMSDTVVLESIWSSSLHFDLDHFDFNDLTTFYPGIDIYRIKSLI